MKQYELSSAVKKIVLSYDEGTHLDVLRAYLVDGKSYRTIQKEILGLPAPAKGGGYIAMYITHYYGISGSDKGILKRQHDKESVVKQMPIIEKLNAYLGYAQQVELQLQKSDFDFHDRKTEISLPTKIRISQNILREHVLKNYRVECALCPINQKDLLVCSHIIPWNIDERNRLNPQNAICFCILHDKLFDKGYFSFSNDFQIIMSNKLTQYLRLLLNDCTFKMPQINIPALPFIEYHRKNILR
jgi:putative restriction endonuclease